MAQKSQGKSSAGSGMSYSSMKFGSTMMGKSGHSSGGGNLKGMQVLGKVGGRKPAIPKPVALPSIKKENYGLDPTVSLVPSGGGGWGAAKSKGYSPATQRRVEADEQQQKQQQQQEQYQQQQYQQQQQRGAADGAQGTKTWGAPAQNTSSARGTKGPAIDHQFPTLGGPTPPQQSSHQHQREVHGVNHMDVGTKGVRGVQWNAGFGPMGGSDRFGSSRSGGANAGNQGVRMAAQSAQRVAVLAGADAAFQRTDDSWADDDTMDFDTPLFGGSNGAGSARVGAPGTATDANRRPAPPEPELPWADEAPSSDHHASSGNPEWDQGNSDDSSGVGSESVPPPPVAPTGAAKAPGAKGEHHSAISDKDKEEMNESIQRARQRRLDEEREREERQKRISQEKLNALNRKVQERTRGSQSSEVQARRAALAEQRQREMLLVQQELAARRQQQQQGGGSGGAVGGKVLVDFVRGDGEDGSSRGGGADGPEQRPEVRADEQRHAPGPWSDSAATATSEDPAANTTTSASDSGTARDGGVDPSDDAAGQDVGRTKPVDTNPWGGADREGGRVRTGEAGLWNAESFPAPGGDGLDDDQPRVRPLTVEEASVRPSAQGKVLFDPYKGEKRSPRSERRVGDRRQRHDSGGDRDHSARNDRGNHRGERGNSRGNAREKADTNTEENVLIRIKGRGNEAAGESRGTKHAAATVDDDASEASSKDAPHKRENRRQQRDHTHKTVSTAGETTSNSDTKSTTPRGRDSKDIRNNRKERGANKDGGGKQGGAGPASTRGEPTVRIPKSAARRGGAGDDKPSNTKRRDDAKDNQKRQRNAQADTVKATNAAPALAAKERAKQPVVPVKVAEPPKVSAWMKPLTQKIAEASSTEEDKTAASGAAESSTTTGGDGGQDAGGKVVKSKGGENQRGPSTGKATANNGKPPTRKEKRVKKEKDPKRRGRKESGGTTATTAATTASNDTPAAATDAPTATTGAGGDGGAAGRAEGSVDTPAEDNIETASEGAKETSGDDTVAPEDSDATTTSMDAPDEPGVDTALPEENIRMDQEVLPSFLGGGAAAGGAVGGGSSALPTEPQELDLAHIWSDGGASSSGFTSGMGIWKDSMSSSTGVAGSSLQQAFTSLGAPWAQHETATAGTLHAAHAMAVVAHPSVAVSEGGAAVHGAGEAIGSPAVAMGAMPTATTTAAANDLQRHQQQQLMMQMQAQQSTYQQYYAAPGVGGTYPAAGSRLQPALVMQDGGLQLIPSVAGTEYMYHQGQSGQYGTGTGVGTYVVASSAQAGALYGRPNVSTGFSMTVAGGNAMTASAQSAIDKQLSVDAPSFNMPRSEGGSEEGSPKAGSDATPTGASGEATPTATSTATSSAANATSSNAQVSSPLASQQQQQQQLQRQHSENMTQAYHAYAQAKYVHQPTHMMSYGQYGYPQYTAMPQSVGGYNAGGAVGGYARMGQQTIGSGPPASIGSGGSSDASTQQHYLAAQHQQQQQQRMQQQQQQQLLMQQQHLQQQQQRGALSSVIMQQLGGASNAAQGDTYRRSQSAAGAASPGAEGGAGAAAMKAYMQVQGLAAHPTTAPTANTAGRQHFTAAPTAAAKGLPTSVGVAGTGGGGTVSAPVVASAADNADAAAPGGPASVTGSGVGHGNARGGKGGHKHMGGRKPKNSNAIAPSASAKGDREVLYSFSSGEGDASMPAGIDASDATRGAKPDRGGSARRGRGRGRGRDGGRGRGRSGGRGSGALAPTSGSSDRNSTSERASAPGGTGAASGASAPAGGSRGGRGGVRGRGRARGGGRAGGRGRGKGVSSSNNTSGSGGPATKGAVGGDSTK